MIVNPGTLKHPITILRNIEKVDEEGFKVKSWVPILTCRAALTKIKVKDLETSEMNTVKNFIECTIRYADVQNTDKIEINKKQYEINEIENIDFLNRFLRITLK